jgi:hypothetical protein
MVVGLISSYPIQVIHDKQKYDASWFVDMYVLPDYRGVGLAGYLWRQVMHASQLVFSISPNKISLQMFRKTGWTEIPGTYYFSLPLGLSRSRFSSNSKLAPFFSSFDKCWHKLYQTRALLQIGPHRRDTYHIDPVSWPVFSDVFGNECSLCDPPLQILYDSKFYRWRIENCSIGGEMLIHRSDHALALIRVIRATDIRQANILLLQTDCPSTFFSHITNWAILQQLDRVVLATKHPKIIRAASRWFPIKKHIPYFVYSTPQSLANKLDADTLSPQLIDSDLDLMVAI